MPVLLALGLMAFSHRERGESLYDIGFSRRQLSQLMPVAAFLPTTLAVIAIMAAAWLTNHGLFVGHLRARYISLPLWALFQQYVLNGFINRRAQFAFGNGVKSVTLVAVVFALLHLPNPLARCPDVCWRAGLGGCISTPAEPVCAGSVSRIGFVNSGTQPLARFTQQSA